MGSSDDAAPPWDNQISAFFTTLRRSAEIAQELTRTTTAQAERIRSLESDLSSARSRLELLESELARIRSALGDRDASRALAQLEELVEEQNCLAHLFVTSDRLARARSAQEALDVVVEVMHNLVGAHRYGIYLRFEPDAEPLLVAPREARYREGGQHHELVARTLDTPARGRRASSGELPICMPIQLDGHVVGALVIDELVAQLGGRFERMQQDLLALLGERLASSLCAGALRGEIHGSPLQHWAALKSGLIGIEREDR